MPAMFVAPRQNATDPERSAGPARRRRSAPGHLLQLFRISSSLYRDLRCGALDLPEIVRCKFNRRGADILLQAMQLRGAGDWNDPRLLREQPGERDLGRR